MVYNMCSWQEDAKRLNRKQKEAKNSVQRRKRICAAVVAAAEHKRGFRAGYEPVPWLQRQLYQQHRERKGASVYENVFRHMRFPRDWTGRFFRSGKPESAAYL